MGSSERLAHLSESTLNVLPGDWQRDEAGRLAAFGSHSGS